MKFPEKPTVHGPSSLSGEARWREPRAYDGGPYKVDYRTCFYCGSIHPEDLLKVLAAGAKLGGADWKYGWPHKFYVDGIPNEVAGQEVNIGGRSYMKNGARVEEAIRGTAPSTATAKWYNEHLLDEGYDEEGLNTLLAALKSSGVEFKLEEGKLKYGAPYPGYQK